MLVKGTLILAALVVVSACTQTIPDSGAGVGFGTADDFLEDQARREAAVAGTSGPLPSAQAIATEDTALAIDTSDLAAAGIGSAIPEPSSSEPLSAVAPREVGIEASPSNPAPELASNPGLSDEQDFSAVTSRESIESDAERLAAAEAARLEAEVTALPTRSGNTGPNIVAYALTAPNRLGQEWYSRSMLSGQARFQRNCAGYNTPDAAQRDFLARGGPDRDPRGIDPDGDGFACGWDPAPFRLAASG